MNYTYTIFPQFQKMVQRSDGACIPFDPANTDYQVYLKWLEEGNVPLAAETNTPSPEENT
jgi:hypothetical protein